MTKEQYDYISTMIQGLNIVARGVHETNDAMMALALTRLREAEAELLEAFAQCLNVIAKNVRSGDSTLEVMHKVAKHMMN